VAGERAKGWTCKKSLIALLVLLVVVALPVLLLSNPMMAVYQKRIEGNPTSGFSRWLQISSANVCSSTWRPERAAHGYQRFLELYPEDERRPFVLLRLAVSLEAAGRSADAIARYEQFLIEYPDRPERDEVRTGLARIRFVRR
jgi:tetratricopeptide (TPR) repeat protein